MKYVTIQENLPNAQNVDNADVVGNSGPADQNEAGRKGNDNDSKVDLSLPVPHRKTGKA